VFANAQTIIHIVNVKASGNDQLDLRPYAALVWYNATVSWFRSVSKRC